MRYENRTIDFRSIKEISKETGFGESKVKTSLLRSRRELKKLLEKEGVLNEG